MAKTEMVRARIEPAVKHKVDCIFSALGLNSSDAINLFYHQVLIKNGLPFDLVLPNELTRNAMKEAQDIEELEAFANIEALKKDLLDEIDPED